MSKCPTIIQAILVIKCTFGHVENMGVNLNNKNYM